MTSRMELNTMRIKMSDSNLVTLGYFGCDTTFAQNSLSLLFLEK